MVSEIKYSEDEETIEYLSELSQLENEDPTNSTPSVLGGLVFKQDYQEAPTKFKYKLRMTPSLAQLRTKELFPAFIPQGPTDKCKSVCILNWSSLS